jgi:hypothetical protein
VAAIKVDGLSDEVVALIRAHARERNVAIQTVARELIHLGLSHELAERAGERARDPFVMPWEGTGASLDILDAVGCLDTADLEQIWS